MHFQKFCLQTQFYEYIAEVPYTFAYSNIMSRSKDSIGSLNDVLASAPEALLRPSDSLRESARSSVKYFLDPVARQYSKVFKNGIYVDGLDALQIWEQTRLVLDGVAENVLHDRYIEITGEDDGEDDELEKIAKRRKLTQVDDDSDESEEEVLQSLSGSEAEVSERGDLDDASDVEDDEDDGEEMDSDASDEELPNGVALVNGVSNQDDDDGDDDDQDIDMENLVDDYEDSEGKDNEEDSEEESKEVFVKDSFGLNDGFFDIDQFNRMTEDAENPALNNDDDDDDEDIDYFADPDEQTTFKQEKAKSSTRDEEDEDNEDSDDYDEDDLEGHFGAVGERNGVAAAAEDNSNDIRYEDFFKSPSNRRQGKHRPERPKRKDKFEGLGVDDVDDADLELAMSDLKKDLFADDDVEDDVEDAGEDGTKLSTFEKMQRKLQSQIAKLEEENVARKNWTMMGEAKASARPLNSLLEEDLEFDRGAKPVPVITREITETLEDLIRNRIKNVSSLFCEYLRSKEPESN